MVDKKKKTTKTKKKIDKKKLKKDLKKKQKKMPKKEFKKLAKKVKSKLEENTPDNILPNPTKKVKSKLEERTKGGQALQNVLSKTRQSIPALPIFNPQVAAKDIKERLQTDTKKEFAKPIKDFKNMKKKYEEVLMKYNNGELSATDLFELYGETKQFANTANEYIPSRTEISNAYKTLKAKLNYFRNFINSNRPSGQNPLQETIIATVRQRGPQPPPAPTPSSNNSPPPPPNNSPDPPPTQSQPTPVPTPSPTLSNIVNAITPEASPQNLAIAGLATLGSGAALLNRMAIMRNQGQLNRLQNEGNILNRGRNLVEAGLGQAVGNQLQQAAQNTLQNIQQAQNNLANVEAQEQQRSTNPTRQRPPLRQSTIDKRTRQSLRRQTLEERRQNRLSGEEGTITPPSLQEQQQMQLEQDLGGGMGPNDPQSVREIMEFERDMAGDLRPVRDESVEARINEQRQIDRLAQSIGSMPQVPTGDIQQTENPMLS